MSPLHAPILAWYAGNARDLPWRHPDAGAWAVLVSEFMLQQTPVARVLPVYAAWLDRWPDAPALAAAEPGEAVRQWGRLGYPRRALRLHAAARVVTAEHGGVVPADVVALRALPGVGSYTAAAIGSFAFGQRHAVLDTNVRRVHARAVGGEAEAAPAQTVGDLRRAEELLPEDPATAARWGVAVMELGALVCTARAPRCGECPVRHLCAWQLAGRPVATGPARRVQSFAGTDRQVRGLLMAVLRESEDAVPAAALHAVWTADPVQRERALDGLVADGLVEPLENGRYRLPVR